MLLVCTPSRKVFPLLLVLAFFFFPSTPSVCCVLFMTLPRALRQDSQIERRLGGLPIRPDVADLSRISRTILHFDSFSGLRCATAREVSATSPVADCKNRSPKILTQKRKFSPAPSPDLAESLPLDIYSLAIRPLILKISTSSLSFSLSLATSIDSSP